MNPQHQSRMFFIASSCPFGVLKSRLVYSNPNSVSFDGLGMYV
jgi:hypothetical protein